MLCAVCCAVCFAVWSPPCYSPCLHTGCSNNSGDDVWQNAMNVLKFSTEEQETILSTVAGVLHFGNVKFLEEKRAMEEDGCTIANPDVVQHACAMWGLDPAAVSKSLTSKNIGTRSIILVQYSVTQAQDARDAMVKRVYANLFQLIVDRINSVLGSGGVERNHFIGVLDIFGFESFDVNSFEQLCINFCNEKLQFHFNEHIFRLEQILYESEGISISSTDFQDNQPTLDLLEAKITGVFSMCDEEISVPRGSDEGMLQKIYQKHMGKHPNLLRPKAKDCLDNLKCFGILHYAGPVYYNVTNFLEKNKDQLHQDIMGTLKGSSKPLIKEMFESEGGDVAPASKTSRGRAATTLKKTGAKTLGAQFKQQLNELMDTLNSTFPHFIRCMKPNDKKVGNLFTAGRMVDQLRYAGLVEVCRIRKLGYPVRRDFDTFYKRYRCCDTTARDLDSLLQSLVTQQCLQPGEWAKGNSKVFLRTAQSMALEMRREKAFGEVSISVQKVMRAYLARKRFAYWRKLMQRVKEGMQAREEEALTYAIDMSFELPHGGSHLQLIKDAKVLQARLREENRVKQLLQNAITQREMSSLKSAIAAAEDMQPPLSSSLIAEAKEVLLRLVEENKVKSDLTAAIAKRDRGALASLLQKAASMNMDCNETRQASALVARLEEEDRATEALRKALTARDMDALEGALSKCSSMGLENADVTAGKALLKQLAAERDARAAISEAMKARDMKALVAALSQAAAVGVPGNAPEVAAGNDLKVVLENEAAAKAALDSAAEGNNLAALEAAITRATSAGLTAATCSSLESAMAMRDSLLAEKNCRAALQDAIKANDSRLLAKSLAEASRLGISGPDVEEARTKSKALGARSDTLDRLSAMASSDMLEDIAAALAEAERMGLSETAEAQAAIAKRDRLREERSLLEELERVTRTATTANQQELSRLVAQAMRVGLTTKYPEQMAAAKARAKALGEEVQMTMKIEVAFRNNDMSSLREIISEAAANGLSTAFGEKKMEELTERQAITASLETALHAKDKDQVLDLLARATEAGLSNETVNQARLFADRAGLEDRLNQALDKAEREMDLKALNAALETAIEMGIRTPAVEKAQQSRSRLEVFDNAASDITAAAQVVVVKLESGIVAGDLAALEAAIAKAQALNPPPEWTPLVTAKANLEVYERHIVVREDLQAALSANDKNAMRTALGDAENLEMRIDEVKRVREILRGTTTEPTTRAAPVEDQDYEEAEKAREERKNLARQARFDLKNFSGLRTPDDFAKGAILNKQSVKDKFLIWQGTVISKSLMDLPKDMSKVAIQIHKDLLGYMGDKHMPFPAMLAQDVLRKGYEIPTIRDEIFLQIIKQLSTNPRAESVAKGWQLMCMCVSTFPPSPDFENFLLHYILNKLERGRGAVVDYAKYCLRTLEGMLSSGESSGFVPSVEEIQAYKERPPILATIELVDGQVITEDLPVTPDLNVGKVLEICSGWLDLKDARASTMGIFVYDLGEIVADASKDSPDPYANAPYADLVRTPRPLRNEDFMGDVIVQKARQRRRFKFVIKKKIFLPQHYHRGDDPYYERLVYLQAEDEIIVQGNVVVASEADAAHMAAISMTVAFGEDMPSSVDGLVAEGVSDFVPPSWRDRKGPEEWAQIILNHRNRLVAIDPENLQAEFVTMAQQLPYYGTHWFYVYKVNNQPKLVADLPRELILAFNSDGMHIFSMNKTLLHSFAFADIYRYH